MNRNRGNAVGRAGALALSAFALTVSGAALATPGCGKGCGSGGGDSGAARQEQSTKAGERSKGTINPEGSGGSGGGGGGGGEALAGAIGTLGQTEQANANNRTNEHIRAGNTLSSDGLAEKADKLGLTGARREDFIKLMSDPIYGPILQADIDEALAKKAAEQQAAAQKAAEQQAAAVQQAMQDAYNALKPVVKPALQQVWDSAAGRWVWSQVVQNAPDSVVQNQINKAGNKAMDDIFNAMDNKPPRRPDPPSTPPARPTTPPLIVNTAPPPVYSPPLGDTRVSPTAVPPGARTQSGSALLPPAPTPQPPAAPPDTAPSSSPESAPSPANTSPVPPAPPAPAAVPEEDQFEKAIRSAEQNQEDQRRPH